MIPEAFCTASAAPSPASFILICNWQRLLRKKYLNFSNEISYKTTYFITYLMRFTTTFYIYVQLSNLAIWRGHIKYHLVSAEKATFRANPGLNGMKWITLPNFKWKRWVRETSLTLIRKIKCPLMPQSRASQDRAWFHCPQIV